MPAIIRKDVEDIIEALEVKICPEGWPLPHGSGQHIYLNKERQT